MVSPSSSAVITDALQLATFGPVIPVIILDELKDAVPLAQALVAGGVRVLEVTLRTPVALECISAIAKSVPEAIVGVGTLRNAGDVTRAKNAGATFGVSPGLTDEIADACKSQHLTLLPGVATPSEMMKAHAAGFNFLKLFPATVVGGAPMLKAVSSPFSDISFCPTGGITPATAPDFLSLPNVKCIGGSWLTPADAIKSGDWKRITTLAQEASQLRK